jgi:hypothetical protein
VLINSLIYFGAKYFMLKTVEQHQRLAFSQVQKQHVNAESKLVAHDKDEPHTTVLRFIPPGNNRPKSKCLCMRLTLCFGTKICTRNICYAAMNQAGIALANYSVKNDSIITKYF